MRLAPRSLFWSSVALLVGVLVAAVGFLGQEPPPLAVARLPNGTELRLEAVTYGPKHSFVRGRYWQRLLAPILSPEWQRRIGAAVFTYRSPNPPALVFWTSGSGAVALPWAYTPAGAIDEHGCDLTSPIYPQDLGLGGFEKVLRASPLPAYPRRGDRVQLRIYMEKGERLIPIVAFVVPNPDPGPHPTWSAQPLPIVERDGDLAFTLTALEYGAKPPSALRMARWEGVCTRMSFRITEQGQPTQQWEPIAVTVSDATGNTMVPVQKARYQSGGEAHLAFYGNLCPRETAWKLRVEFARTAGFTPADLWTVRRVPVPRRGHVGRPVTVTTPRGLTLTLKLRSGDQSPELFSLPVEIVTAVDGVRVALVKATDEQGRGIVPVGGRSPSFLPSQQEMPGQQVEVVSPSASGISAEEVFRGRYYQLRLPPRAKRLDLTFAVTKSRFAEFVVQPARR